jgi:hypothetical protein
VDSEGGGSGCSQEFSGFTGYEIVCVSGIIEVTRYEAYSEEGLRGSKEKAALLVSCVYEKHEFDYRGGHGKGV